MLARRVLRLRWPLLGAGTAALILAATSGATHLGSLLLGHANTSTAQTTLTANLVSPVLKVVNQGGAAALRGDAQTGIGVNGVSVSGTGQQGVSQSGIGLVGAHSDPTGINPGIQGSTASTDPGGAGVVGKNTGGGPGLRSIVNAGAPPLAVNSTVKVANLNADLLDGLDSTGLQKRVTGSCAAGSAIRVVNDAGTVTCEPVSLTGAWGLSGNAGTVPGTDFLGTTDNQALELKVNGQRALRLEPKTGSPNLIGGFSENAVQDGAHGATIAGGGKSGLPNLIFDDNGTVGGGVNNRAGILDTFYNSASGATVAGGAANTAGAFVSTVGGGNSNTAGGDFSTVAGGVLNNAGAKNSVVAGGFTNTASGYSSTVAGGRSNTAGSDYSTVAGGYLNTASSNLTFAAGYRAKAMHSGSFVWGDSTDADITSPGPNTFTVRATGGSRFDGPVRVTGAFSPGFDTFPNDPAPTVTPDVSGGNVFGTQNVVPAMIVGFAGGMPGQTITIVFQDGVTTVQSNAVVHLEFGVDFFATTQDTLTLVSSDGVQWFETSRSVN
jgi:hypothetical protein